MIEAESRSSLWRISSEAKNDSIHGSQRQQGVVAADLPVERRIAVDKIDGEAELRGEELDGCYEVTNVKVRGHGSENRLRFYVSQ